MTHTGPHIPVDHARWSFSGPVAQGFDIHITQSVPLYQAAHDLILNFSDFFVQPQSLIYDLGCATGHLTQQLARRHSAKSPQLIAIDSEPDMIQAALKNAPHSDPIHFQVASLIEIDLQPCDLIIACYTLQFIPARDRQKVFNRIYQALNWGGALILFEKVRAPDARFQDMITTLYHDWKLHRGLLPQEIMAKTNSLKGILDPFSTQGNLDLLNHAGFVDICSVFKMLCFEGFLAIK